MVAPPTPAGVKHRQIPNGLLRGTRSPGPWQPSLEVAGNVCLDSVADGRDGPGQSHRPGGVVAGNGPYYVALPADKLVLVPGARSSTRYTVGRETENSSANSAIVCFPASQGSQTFDTRDQARDFKHDLLARLARGSWVDPRLGKQAFEAWAREWWEVWSTDPDRSSPTTLQATEGRLRRYLLPFFGQHQLRAITVSMVRRWQNELRGTVGHDTVMACRSVLNRILQAAEDDRRIDANPVRKVPAPRPPVDTDARLGHAKRRTYSPEEFGRLLAGARPFYRDHLLCLVGTGLRAGELLGLRAHRVDLTGRRLEVLEVRYEAGKFGRGYKNRPKSATSIRVVPLAGQVAAAVARQLPDGCPPSTLVFAGPGGGNGVPAGTRTALSRDNLHRAYHAAVARVADPVAILAYTPKRVLRVLRDAGTGQTSQVIRSRLPGRRPTLGTVHDALWQLEMAGLVTREDAGNGQPPCWSPTDPPRDRTLDHLNLRGPHDLRHTFSTWLEDAGIPARVIDELMGHAGGRRGGREGSAIGLRYRHTTPEMEARVVAAIEDRLAVALEMSDQQHGFAHGPSNTLL
jgi:integrase